ncbi:MAG: hypothetical protein ABJD13_08355 [Paracoccaceae bacterium]
MKAARHIAIALFAVIAPLHAVAQGWPNLDQLLFSTLTQSGTAEASFWLPDHPNADQATRALGVVYEHIPGSAGNTGIALGIYTKAGSAWQFVGPVEGVFGQSPRDPAFAGNFLDITTSLVGPNDARCCPTLAGRWRIDLSTFTATRLN